MFRANAQYEGLYLLGTSIARPLISKKQIEIARKVGADAVSHGATGKGNDQVRFELAYYALEPDIKVIAPWREWDLTSRTALLDFAEKNQIPISKDKRGEAPFSVDANLLHASSEGKVLEDPGGGGAGLRLQPHPFAGGGAGPGDLHHDGFRARRPRRDRRRAAFARHAPDQAERAGARQRHRPPRPGGEPLRRHEEPRHVRDAGRTILALAHRGIESITLDRGAAHLKDELMPKICRTDLQRLLVLARARDAAGAHRQEPGLRLGTGHASSSTRAR